MCIQFHKAFAKDRQKYINDEKSHAKANEIIASRHIHADAITIRRLTIIFAQSSNRYQLNRLVFRETFSTEKMAGMRLLLNAFRLYETKKVLTQSLLAAKLQTDPAACCCRTMMSMPSELPELSLSLSLPNRRGSS